MAEPEQERLHALYQDLCEGARGEGEPAPSAEEVYTLAALLRQDAPAAVPADLVPSLQAALREATAPARSQTSARALVRLLWAEARFLPLSFFVLQAVLLALALLANRYLTGFAGSPIKPGSGLPSDLREALRPSVDALTLLAPWLGLAVALFAALPTRRGLWADLEVLSPLSGPARLLTRAAIATVVAAGGTALAGLCQAGPPDVPVAPLLLARTAPLFLAVTWALVWSLPFGAPGAVIASLALWGGLTWYGKGLGHWNLLAPPSTGDAALVRILALLAALVLLAVIWLATRRREMNREGTVS